MQRPVVALGLVQFSIQIPAAVSAVYRAAVQRMRRPLVVAGLGLAGDFREKRVLKWRDQIDDEKRRMRANFVNARHGKCYKKRMKPTLMHAVRSIAAAVCIASLLPFAHADSPATQPVSTGAAKKLRVAIYLDKGGSADGQKNVDKCLAVLPGGFDSYTVDAQAIRDGKLAGADVLVQPGGSGSGQAKALQPEGRKIIQDFVRNGGGYVGICAGAYLATNDYPWSLGFLNAKVVDKAHWARGPEAHIKLHFTDDGQKALGMSEGVKEVIYHQGPILAPSTQPDMPAYTPLAVYDTEVVKKDGGIPGLMVGATAIASGEYGRGHVIAIGPHPERSPGMDGVIRRAVQWAAGLPSQVAGK